MDSQNSSNLIHPPICIEMNDSSFIELRDGGNFLEPKCSPEVFKIIGRESPGSSNTELRHVDKKNQASAALAQLLTCQAVELKLCLAVGDPFSPKLFPVHYGDGLSGQNFGPMMAVLRNMAKPSILLPVWSSFMVNTVTNPKGRFNRTRCLLLITEAPKTSNLLLFKFSLVIQILSPLLPVVAPVPNTKPSVSLPYPSRRDNEKSRNQANEQIDKFYEIFKEMSFEISFTDALVLMPKFASTLRTLLGNKEET
ncbi:hypothetical protein Tco_0796302 [Tanacetum coccineum]